MPLILGTNSIKDTGYEVANSLRFNSGSTDYLSKTFGTATNTKKFTWSFWVKRTKLGAGQYFFENVGSHTYQGSILFDSNDRLQMYEDGLGSGSGMYLITNRKFRDISAWYHIVIAVDSTQSTSSNRAKFYVNGTQETSFQTSTYPSQNHALPYISGSGDPCNIGKYDNTNSNFDGYLCEVVFCDGQTLAPTDFGEFDSRTNIWKPIDVSGLTFGNNGLYLDFENSGSLGADVSGNSNNFTVNNLTSIDQSIDTCTNNGLTLNPLASNSSYAFSDGNLTLAINGVNDEEKMIPATFGASSGKWYWEIKNTSSSNTNYIHAGYGTDEFISNYINGSQSTSNYTANNGYWNGIQGRGTASAGVSILRAGNSSNYNVSNTFLQNSIAMFALDLDNRKCWVGLDGTWVNDSSGNTGNPSTGAYPTWDSNDLVSTDKIWMPTLTGYYSQPTCSLNFGSPPYSVSSSNSDADGVGNYEYTVPTAFRTWNTKNLSEYG